MRRLKDFIKKNFPGFYDYCLHIKRRRLIKKINHLKELNIDEIKALLNEEYKNHIGHDIHWDNLKTYTEKMQWEKIYNKDPQKTLLSDKYLVRKWVKEKIGQEHLIPLLGVWDSFDEIDFNKLPDKFVLKTNHGSGTNLIIKDKKTLNYKEAKRTFDDWMQMDFAYVDMFQLHYSGIERKIIAEQYMETDIGELQDYKFLCFDGVPYFCWVDLGRFSNHTRTVFDMDWKLQPWTQAEYGISPTKIPKPKNYDKMIKYAKILSKGFKQVRVDFYNIDGKIYFGEMTFTNGSGMDKIIPEKYDEVLGSYWKMDNKNEK